MKLSSILIADDSEADQFLCKIMIEEFNSEIKIFQAYDGQGAFEIIEEHGDKIDVILLDVNMPRMNGHAFLNAHAEKIDEYSIPVVMLTSSNQEKDRFATEKYECVKKYMEKPLSAESLKELSKLISE